MVISALDKHTAKLISTTQVITSISSAAKELIENALDANAKNIEINLIDNGATLIEVKDDGCGISKVDASYMALSSYTSKLLNFSDLESLETYGFRGEALYALSVISDITIISKTEADDVGVCYTIDHNGCITKSEPCHRSTGTTVQVRQLFKQVPVQRQLITNQKKGHQDIKILESLIKSYGICKFSVRISYKVDSNMIFAKPGTSTVEEAVTYILGKKVRSNMTWIAVEDAEVNAKLMVPLKETQNMSEVFQSGAQYIFVNNRPIKHKDLEKTVTKSILETLGQDSSSRKKPIFILSILTNARNIDVNLDPNKTSVLFKDQKLVLDTVDKRIRDYYGIQREVQDENACDKSLSDYHDYTQKTSTDDVENEWPACKKRKLQREGSGDRVTEKKVCAPKQCDDNVGRNFNFSSSNSECNKQTEVTKNQTDDQNEGGSKCRKNANDIDLRLPSLNLSDCDSNDSQNFTVVPSEREVFSNSNNASAKENTDDSPPLEMTPASETLSQLPIVDFGEDFNWNDYGKGTSEKENMIQNLNVAIGQKGSKLDKKKETMTLEKWSKGHVPGFKGGTDVHVYLDTGSDATTESDSYDSNLCTGFLKYSKHIRQKVMEQNPTMTAPQIANAITNLWKKLSPEERGYYRDLAREEKRNSDTENRETKEKPAVESKKNRKRILKVLENMKTMNLEKKENLLIRTIVPWDMHIKKVTESFLNKSICKHKNIVIGTLYPNLWIVKKSSDIWILDAVRLKKELNVPDTSTDEESAESIERLLEQWFSVKDDWSLLHPVYSLTRNGSKC
ncbi:uncharacterized protein LOC143370274 [Andrena cerasifolii]|uniref:uncharacterized protein LOC143370274 n=1 Tax=Andrena cerasifolii TaxID=2819439 RepID=UPI0040381858